MLWRESESFKKYLMKPLFLNIIKILFEIYVLRLKGASFEATSWDICVKICICSSVSKFMFVNRTLKALLASFSYSWLKSSQDFMVATILFCISWMFVFTKADVLSKFLTYSVIDFEGFIFLTFKSIILGTEGFLESLFSSA